MSEKNEKLINIENENAVVNLVIEELEGRIAPTIPPIAG